MILYNLTLVVWSLVFILFYGWFVWKIYDKNDKLVSFISMILLTLILILWFTHVIFTWNYFELMLRILHQ
ncbi:hypothetical phage protein [Campylobacter phage CPt10]|uniref:Hypothetical phage protein n=1 Tax=Campylobacter phage CPt10 TaxID=2994045 RepID=D5GVX8_9CAUD|nr:hypothetical protein APL46_gp187 [Campylobacter phage CPt10]CBJ94345.1 hypothetical phage protein [Campylobacter phage CPt10]